MRSGRKGKWILKKETVKGKMEIRVFLKCKVNQDLGLLLLLNVGFLLESVPSCFPCKSHVHSNIPDPISETISLFFLLS